MKAKPKESAPSVQSHWHQMNRKQRRDMERKIQSADLSLQLVHPDAAGVDIGNEYHYVAVPPDRDSQPIQHFRRTTAELKTMADWLKKCGIRTAAMQSTGVDGEKAASLAHALKGPVGVFGADAACHWCQRLQDLAHQGDSPLRPTSIHNLRRRLLNYKQI